MKNVIFTILLLAFAAVATAQAPVISHTTTTADSWNYSVSLTPFPGVGGVSQYSHLYEYCYQNPGEDSVCSATNFLAYNSGVSGCAPTYMWYYGIQPNAKIWFNEYRAPHPYQAGSYFYPQYESVKNDRANWYQSNKLTVTDVPGCPITTFKGKGKGKGK